jgi:hypothetical protein
MRAVMRETLKQFGREQPTSFDRAPGLLNWSHASTRFPSRGVPVHFLLGSRILDCGVPSAFRDVRHFNLNQQPLPL